MIKAGKRKLAMYLAFGILFSAVILFVLYRVAVPGNYDFKVGDKVPETILSTRPVVDRAATERRAKEQAGEVSDVMLRSAKISNQCLSNLESFFSDVRQQRKELVKAKDAALKAKKTWNSQEEVLKATEKLKENVLETYQVDMNSADLAGLLALEDSLFEAISKHTVNAASIIMEQDMGTFGLQVAITTQVNSISEANPLYVNEYKSIQSFLGAFLKNNMVVDIEATEAAREAVRTKVWLNPIMIPEGTQIVAKGETLTAEQYQTLVDLDLMKTGQINFTMLGSLFALYIFCCLLLFVYLHWYDRVQMRTVKDWLIALSTIVLVIVISAYITTISPYLIPVYFVAIVLSMYFGLRTSLVFTLLLILLLFPVSSMSSQFLFVGTLGSAAAAMITASQTKDRNYLAIIAGTIASCFVASILYSSMTQINTDLMLENALYFTISGGLSSILAIGLAPIYEAVLSRVFPLKLIKLSEPSQPLLRKLFLEAPGTYQHSMMLANLAETAAERIGADTLLTRVGAYYHDIGKTWNPLMYTENQQGFNPHSLLTTEESVRVIFRHVSAGVEMAKKNHLPQEVIEFITTHHGTTVLSYFFTQACNEAEEKGLPLPDPKDFTYPGKRPTTKETGIFMLADTTEAAMKSAGVTHLDAAEERIRKLFRTKMDQDQLVDSGLSFYEVEEIIKAFLQVYAGQFHERIKYPDARPISKSRK